MYLSIYLFFKKIFILFISSLIYVFLQEVEKLIAAVSHPDFTLSSGVNKCMFQYWSKQVLIPHSLIETSISHKSQPLTIITVHIHDPGPMALNTTTGT